MSNLSGAGSAIKNSALVSSFLLLSSFLPRAVEDLSRQWVARARSGVASCNSHPFDGPIGHQPSVRCVGITHTRKVDASRRPESSGLGEGSPLPRPRTPHKTRYGIPPARTRTDLRRPGWLKILSSATKKRWSSLTAA